MIVLILPVCWKVSRHLWSRFLTVLPEETTARNAHAKRFYCMLTLRTNSHNAEACASYIFVHTRSDTYMHGEFTQSMWLFTPYYWFSTAFSGRRLYTLEIFLSDYRASRKKGKKKMHLHILVSREMICSADVSYVLSIVQSSHDITERYNFHNALLLRGKRIWDRH